MKFSGVTILQGVEFSIFPIDFEWALQQCIATALPVIQRANFGMCYIVARAYSPEQQNAGLADAGLCHASSCRLL